MTEFSTATDDSDLVSHCLKGNEQAWAALIEKYKRLIYSVPVKYHATPEDSADIFQAVCLELFSALPRLRNSGSLRSWLVTVATHKCLHWKQKQPPPGSGNVDDLAPDLPADGAGGTAALEEIEREQILREAIDQIPPRCREMIRLLFYETPPLPYNEVAQRLGLATGSIGFIRGRCLKKLEQALRKLGF